MDVFEKDFTLSGSIGHIVNIVANRMKQELENNFLAAGYDVTALQWMVLSIVYEKEGIVQNDIVKLAKKEKTNIARIVDKLEKKALINRVKDDEDKRSLKLYLTDSGKQMKEELTQVTIDTLKKATAGVSEEEYTVCLNVLKKIYLNLE